MSAAMELMLLGMGTVFVFLTVLVVATGFMSNALKDFGFSDDKPASKPTPAGNDIDPKLRQAISLAVQKYRREHDG